MRIGHGFDIHPLVKGRRLVLAGVEVPSDTGCLGHSDADVVLHAVTDALLGALSLGDIGEWFPDTDPSWKDADSSAMLARVMDELSKRRVRPVNIDVTIYLERPKLGPLKERMRDNIASICGIEPSCVGLKARTFEGFGPVGAAQAVSATAVVLVDSE